MSFESSSYGTTSTGFLQHATHRDKGPPQSSAAHLACILHARLRVHRHKRGIDDICAHAPTRLAYVTVAPSHSTAKRERTSRTRTSTGTPDPLGQSMMMHRGAPLARTSFHATTHSSESAFGAVWNTSGDSLRMLDTDIRFLVDMTSWMPNA